MNYQEFKNFIMENIKNYLPDKYQDAEIMIHPVRKNNGVDLDGIIIRLPDQNICPNIYLNSFYQNYEEGQSIEDIMAAIGHIRDINDKEENIKVDDMADFENIKDCIVFRVVGTEKNRDMLQDMPHHVEHDMSLTYQIMVQKTEEGTAYVQITNSMMDELGVDEGTLYEAAMKNTPREFPMTFQSMDDIMREMLRQNFMGFNLDTLSEKDEMKSFLEMLFEKSMSCMACDATTHVLSNKYRQYGAAVLFYPQMQEKLAEQIGTDYFVLPSSIHEVMIVPEQEGLDYQVLKDMVQQVNSTDVSPDEILTDEVYHYDRKNKKLDHCKQ